MSAAELRARVKDCFLGPDDNIVGRSAKMREMYALIERAAASDITVLVQGESGTGKELVARAVHSESRRKRGPFVPVNCAAVPESLIESELFGHERGAFTGATMRRIGRFEQAEGGAIFLDEIGDMSLPLQAKLLRVLQEREIQRVGGAATIAVDVRVIAATNRDLTSAVQAGAFREDLYYRTAVFPILVPPLRERRDDIPLLAEHFLRKYAQECGREVVALAPDTLRALMDYAWPGNVRELGNAIERGVLIEPAAVLRPESLPAALHTPSGPRAREFLLPEALVSLDEAERLALLHTVELVGNDAHRCADALGINRATFYRKLRRHGLALR
jgi:transcriptional regulator with GAF, ATPase, and Fis domain